MSNVYKPPHRTPRTPAWQLPLHEASVTASTLLDQPDIDEDISQDIHEIYENILRLERILYEEKTHGFLHIHRRQSNDTSTTRL